MDKLVGLIAVVLALTLAIRSYRSRQVQMKQTATMILIWILIFAVLALIFNMMGAGVPS